MYLKAHIINLLISASFLISTPAAAANVTVPFQNEIVDVNQTITADYSFGTNSMIFCYSNESINSGGTGNITWSFNGQIKNGTLPITLVNNTNFQGELADGSGTLTIQNTLSTSSIINCVYGF